MSGHPLEPRRYHVAKHKDAAGTAGILCMRAATRSTSTTGAAPQLQTPRNTSLFSRDPVAPKPKGCAREELF